MVLVSKQSCLLFGDPAFPLCKGSVSSLPPSLPFFYFILSFLIPTFLLSIYPSFLCSFLVSFFSFLSSSLPHSLPPSLSSVSFLFPSLPLSSSYISFLPLFLPALYFFLPSLPSSLLPSFLTSGNSSQGNVRGLWLDDKAQHGITTVSEAISLLQSRYHQIFSQSLTFFPKLLLSTPGSLAHSSSSSLCPTKLQTIPLFCFSTPQHDDRKSELLCPSRPQTLQEHLFCS